MSANKKHIDDSSDVGEGEYTIESIVDFRYNRKAHRDEWLIKWKGYGPEDDTWEPFENFADCAESLVQIANDLKAMYNSKPRGKAKGKSRPSPKKPKVETRPKVSDKPSSSESIVVLDSESPSPSGLLFSRLSATTSSPTPPQEPTSTTSTAKIRMEEVVDFADSKGSAAKRNREEPNGSRAMPQPKKRKIDSVGNLQVESLDEDSHAAVTEVQPPRIVTPSDVTESTSSSTVLHIPENAEKKDPPAERRDGRDRITDVRTKKDFDLRAVYRNLTYRFWTVKAIEYQANEDRPWHGDVILHIATDKNERLALSMWDLKLGSHESFGLAERPLVEFFFHQCRNGLTEPLFVLDAEDEADY